MARLSESQLAGFRTGTTTSPDRAPGRACQRDTGPQEPGSNQPALALVDVSTTMPSCPLGPVPSAPARSDPRHKIGLTLPAELAAEVRSFLQQGYALADLVMVAYQNHREDLVREHRTRTTRQLQRRKVGRGSFTISVSAQERDALDELARHLDATRSRLVAALLERYLQRAATETSAPHTKEP